MGKKSGLTNKQVRVIDDLMVGSMSEADVLAKHNVSAALLGRWLCDDLFAAKLSERMQTARLRSQLIIARFSQVAATRLIELTECEKEETARKACLDVISLPIGGPGDKGKADEQKQPDSLFEKLTPEMAGRMLRVLAGK